MPTSFTLPFWYDLHTHLRQDGLLQPLIQAHLDGACCGVLAMPNTKPPLSDIERIEAYLDEIKRNGGDAFDDIIVPLYLTKDTDAKMIEKGAKKKTLRAAKYYPPHGTTNAEFGAPFEDFLKSDVFRAMEDNNVVLCIHGEQHALAGERYFAAQTNAEDIFYREQMPRLLDKHPLLRVVAEHVTTKTAVDLIGQAGPNVAATITPQHLLFTIGDLLQGLKYHLYCLPVVKFATDRDALRKAVTSSHNTKFFAGTDSAPHTQKATECGCAAGCFTAGYAVQLYAQAFEEAGLDLSQTEHQKIFETFLCTLGPKFYGLKPSSKRFTLTKTPQEVKTADTSEGPLTPLPLGLGHSHILWSLSY